jgi:hypothetical protein
VGALTLAPAAAYADPASPANPASPASPASAETLFRDGRARAEAGDFSHACPLFAESLRLDYALGTLFNLAACEEHLGSLVHAWEHYAEVAERLPPDDDRREVVRERIASLDRLIPRLTIVVSAAAPPDTHVTRDRVELRGPSLDVALPVDAGDHEIAVDAPGRAVKRWDVRLALGERRVVVVVPGEPTTQSAPETTPAQSSSNHTAEWILGGAGVASIAVGSYFGVRALSKRSDSNALCNGDACSSPAGLQEYDDAKTFSRVSDVAFGVGIVAVAAASYLLLTSAHRERVAVLASDRVSFHLGPTGLAGTW